MSRTGALQEDGRAGRAAEGRTRGAPGRGKRRAWQGRAGRAAEAAGHATEAAGRAAEAAGRASGAAGPAAEAAGRASGARSMSGRRAGVRAATRPRGCCDTAPVRTVRAAMHGLGVAWCAGWASWGLMQPVWFLTWVFDSGVFLSHRMDSVHEHCSSRNFSEKKN